jgi:hypothetical protein
VAVLVVNLGFDNDGICTPHCVLLAEIANSSTATEVASSLTWWLKDSMGCANWLSKVAGFLRSSWSSKKLSKFIAGESLVFNSWLYFV